MGNSMMTMSNAMVTAVLNKGLWGSGSKSHKGGKERNRKKETRSKRRKETRTGWKKKQ